MTIERRGLVSRHNPVITGIEPDSPLGVGNGEFAFTADFTGLQTFPEVYRVPLGTQSSWGWHSSGGKGRVTHDQLRLTPFDTYGRPVGYAYGEEGQERDYHWLRQNPHRLQLGQLGLILWREDGSIAEATDMTDIRQTLHLWEGRLESCFTLEGVPVQVETVCHPGQDLLAVRIDSPLLAAGRLAVKIDFPSPAVVSDEWDKSTGLTWSPEGHETRLLSGGGEGQCAAEWRRSMDADGYIVRAGWSRGRLRQAGVHGYVVEPGAQPGSWELAAAFLPADQDALAQLSGQNALLSYREMPAQPSNREALIQSVSREAPVHPLAQEMVTCTPGQDAPSQPSGDEAPAHPSGSEVPSQPSVAGESSFAQALVASRRHWAAFWQNGGAVDFSACTDPRAPELERRVILSQFLTAIHCTGSSPPQETGLLYNSWFGKFHLEMHWWHSAHFALWNRTPLLEASMGWYSRILPKARKLAASQGYKGARWPKMVGPDGEQGPSVIAPLLIWQQPHPIMLAELCYRNDPGTLVQYASIVLESAEFMASFAHWDKEQRRFVLGPPIIPAQECHRPEETLNPPFEVEYWRYGLKTAQLWRERLGLPPEPEWDRVIQGLSALPVSEEGVYLAHENCPDTYTRYNEDHPSMLGALGILPGELVDRATMEQTLHKAVSEWRWDTSWGWDFPMAAMTASALSQPEQALNLLLLEQAKNIYLPNGHNYQRPGLSAYLPGNGGLLAALAVICTGNSSNIAAIPAATRSSTLSNGTLTGGSTLSRGTLKAGGWTIQWEGLSPLHDYSRQQ